MKLIVGTDSTWSLRAWICARLAGLDVDIEVIDLSSLSYKNEIAKYSQAGLVPILEVESYAIHDSLAIAEYLQEISNGKLYPASEVERAQARSLCAELHSGFSHLRTKLPFTLNRISPYGYDDDEVENELRRIEQIFTQAQMPFMFGDASAVDAFYSILAFRLKTYGIELNGKAGEYQQSLLDWSVLNQSIELAAKWNSDKE
ncbi:MAG: glutathione S-transferase [Pseudomonadota bacterium]